VFDWPTNGKLGLPGLKNPVLSATLLATGKKLPVATNPTGVIVSLPATAPDALSTTVVLKIKGTPEVVPLLLRQSADGTVRLPASEATTHGQLRYEVGAGKDNIGHWTNPTDWVEWQFRAIQPGKMEVSVELAAEQSGKFILALAGQKLEGTAPVTGSYTKFQRLSLGTLDLTAGENKLSIRPVVEGWRPVNLKSVTLTPSK
jgi:alpha-L-fucosidase